MTPERLAEIRSRATRLHRGTTRDSLLCILTGTDVPALLADNARLQNLVTGLLEEGAARDRVVEAGQAWRIAHDDYHQGVPSDSSREEREIVCMDTHAELVAALDAEQES